MRKSQARRSLEKRIDDDARDVFLQSSDPYDDDGVFNGSCKAIVSARLAERCPQDASPVARDDMATLNSSVAAAAARSNLPSPIPVATNQANGTPQQLTSSPTKVAGAKATRASSSAKGPSKEPSSKELPGPPAATGTQARTTPPAATSPTLARKRTLQEANEDLAEVAVGVGASQEVADWMNSLAAERSAADPPAAAAAAPAATGGQPEAVAASAAATEPMAEHNPTLAHNTQQAVSGQQASSGRGGSHTRSKASQQAASGSKGVSPAQQQAVTQPTHSGDASAAGAHGRAAKRQKQSTASNTSAPTATAATPPVAPALPQLAHGSSSSPLKRTSLANAAAGSSPAKAGKGQATRSASGAAGAAAAADGAAGAGAASPAALGTARKAPTVPVGVDIHKPHQPFHRLRLNNKARAAAREAQGKVNASSNDAALPDQQSHQQGDSNGASKLDALALAAAQSAENVEKGRGKRDAAATATARMMAAPNYENDHFYSCSQ